MTDLPVLANGAEGGQPVGLPTAGGLTEAQARLRRMVLDAVTSPTPGATTPKRSTTCSPSPLAGR
jgi:hypothetical protein